MRSHLRKATHVDPLHVYKKRAVVFSAHTTIVEGDARKLPLDQRSVDVVVTSPPYWRKRDYGIIHQIGQ